MSTPTFINLSTILNNWVPFWYRSASNHVSGKGHNLTLETIIRVLEMLSPRTRTPTFPACFASWVPEEPWSTPWSLSTTVFPNHSSFLKHGRDGWLGVTYFKKISLFRLGRFSQKRALKSTLSLSEKKWVAQKSGSESGKPGTLRFWKRSTSEAQIISVEASLPHYARNVAIKRKRSIERAPL